MSEETVLFHGSPSPVVEWAGFTIGLVVLAASVALSLLFLPIFLALTVGSVIYLAIQWWIVKSRVYEVTTERIRVTTGLFTRRTDETELYRVKDATLVEPLLMRFLALGNIEITTADPSTPTLTLEAIPGAKALREELRMSIETCRERKRVRLAEID